MKCFTCNCDHNGSFGSGRFCSKSCANSRIRTKEIKEKISSGVKDSILTGKAKKPNHKGRKLPPRTIEHSTKISSNMIAYWDKKGRVSKEHKKAGNKANVYAYRARKRNAVPADANLELIRKIYQFAPEGYEVDHIIPLANGGLHHQDNLQYLPASENARKGKRNVYDESKVIKWQDLI